MKKREKVKKGLKCCIRELHEHGNRDCGKCPYYDPNVVGCCEKLNTDILEVMRQDRRNWKELKKTLEEMRDGNGTATMQKAAEFLVNLMKIMEREEE